MLPTTLDQLYPTVLFSGVTRVGECEGVTLDITGSTGRSGRSFQVFWSASSTSDVTVVKETIEQANVGQGKSIVQIPPEGMVPGATYVFSARITNFLGLSNQASITILKENIPIPQVKVLFVFASFPTQSSTQYILNPHK